VIDDRARLIAGFIFIDAVGLWVWLSFRRRRPPDDDRREAPPLR
jgi:hypothetical protein